MERSLEIRCDKLEELPAAAAGLLAFARETGRKVWLFEGIMGAGKTTLIKAICKQLGVEDTVQSPTFSIVNEYSTLEGEAVYHFDFYRIDEVAEAVQIGAEEYFYSGALCLIEWPSKVTPILPEEYLEVRIALDKDTNRKIFLSVHG